MPLGKDVHIVTPRGVTLSLQTLIRNGYTDDPRDIDGGAPFAFNFDPAYCTEKSYSNGIAWRVDGWETEPNEDTEWTGLVSATGRVSPHMIGDDRSFAFDPEELYILKPGSYCVDCGQVGCMAHTEE